MDQIRTLLAALSAAQKAGLVLAALLIAAGVPLFTRWQHERDFRPLFTNMAPEDAGAVVQKLKEGGVEHRLSDNGATVLVPAEKVNDVRLELAGMGLPKTGRIGFELFDKTNIGLTDFTEHVNYRRALEGELERSIKAIESIEQARVHVSFPKDSVFLDAREPAKASVLVHLRVGARLTPQNVVAITNLVGSAVEGLSPEFVSVVDMQGNLLSRPHKRSLDSADASEELLDYKHQVEKDLSNKVEATLEPLLGEGKFRVGISADCDFSTSEQTEELYDPTRSVMSTSQKSEDLAGAAQPAGVPGTPANLPRSTIRPGAAGGGSTVSRRTENVSFETSRTVRQVKTPRGVVKRLSAALLIDQDVEWKGKGAQRKRLLIPPTPEKLKAIHDVLAGVLGIVPERGDQLVIESLPFEQTKAAEELAGEPVAKAIAKTPLEKLLENKIVLIGGGAGALVLLLLAFFFLRRKPRAGNANVAGALAGGEGGAAAHLDSAKGGHAATVAPAKLPMQIPAMTGQKQMLLAHVKESVTKDPVFAANIVRGWLEEE